MMFFKVSFSPHRIRTKRRAIPILTTSTGGLDVECHLQNIPTDWQMSHRRKRRRCKIGFSTSSGLLESY